MKKTSLILVLMFVLGFSGCATAVSRSTSFDVTKYGATGDGQTLDSPAINKAIQACSQAGGGTVYFPSGNYLSGSIRLKSNVALHIDFGATIVAAPNKLKVYDIYDPNPWNKPVAYADFGHCHWKNSLIWAVSQENIAITGLGTIDGSNLSGGVVKPGEGNKSIGLKLCRNVLIRDITIKNGGWFAILPTGCDNMVIDNVKIDTNRDGINLDCCRNVRLANCTINSPGDDSICLKSSYALGYKKTTEDVTITNCLVSGYHKKEKRNAPTMLQGGYEGSGISRIKFGTESNGGFKNIVISNCILRNCFGITMQINDGGDLENVSVSNIVMKNVIGGPICLEINNRARGPENPPIGTMRNINMSNIVATNCTFSSVIKGMPGHPVENISLNNIQIITSEGGSPETAKEPAETAPGDGPWQVGRQNLPSYGFYCRHVKGLSFNNVRLSTDRVDTRPAFVFEDVEGLELNGVKAQRSPGSKAPVVYRNTKDVVIYNSPSLSLEAGGSN